MPPAALERCRAVEADGAVQEIHGRRADEAGDEQVLRPIIKLERRADLLDQAVMHHHDPIGHGHGLDLVMGDVDGGGLEALVQFLDLGAHGDAQLGVEIRQRLVEQENLRIAHNGAPHRDALALAAGQLARIAVEQRVEPENIGGALDAAVDLGPRRAPQLEREAHIGGDRHVGIERIVLEHHGDVALLRRHVVDHALADADLARGDVLQPRNHAQQGRLAASRRPHQHDELAVADRDADAMDDLDRAESLADVADRDWRHSLLPGRSPPLFRARRSRHRVR